MEFTLKHDFYHVSIKGFVFIFWNLRDKIIRLHAIMSIKFGQKKDPTRKFGWDL